MHSFIVGWVHLLCEAKYLSKHIFVKFDAKNFRFKFVRHFYVPFQLFKKLSEKRRLENVYLNMQQVEETRTLLWMECLQLSWQGRFNKKMWTYLKNEECLRVYVSDFRVLMLSSWHVPLATFSSFIPQDLTNICAFFIQQFEVPSNRKFFKS